MITSSIIHRDQHQIRAQFLNSLGIVKAAPNSSSTPEKLKCDDGNDQVVPVVSRDDDSTTTTCIPKVSFAVQLEDIQEIPSHRAYSAATRQDLWNGQQAVAAIVQRCTVEFLAEGWDWEQVLEEDAFVTLPNGDLIHPAMLQKQQQDKQARQRKKKQKQYKYKSITACLDFSSSAAARRRSPSPRSRQRKRSAGRVVAQ